MKTFKAIFGNHLIKPDKDIIASSKEYTFNTPNDIKPGDVIESPRYKNKFLHVTEVLDKSYSHVNIKTGELSLTPIQEPEPGPNFPITEIIILDKNQTSGRLVL